MLFMLLSVALLVMFASLSLLVCGLLDFRVCSGVGVNTLIRERGSMGGALVYFGYSGFCSSRMRCPSKRKRGFALSESLSHLPLTSA